MTTETNASKSPHMSTEPRYLPHEVPNNGLVLDEVYLPDKILTQILSYVHVKYLLKNCLYVCHKWKELIQHEVWKFKAERGCLHKLISNKPSKPTRLPDVIYQAICCNVGYNRNLLENNSGQLGLEKWNILESGGDDWQIESPAAGVPRPKNATYNEPKHCFVTSYIECKKTQTISLINKGIHPVILDEFQPGILVSEWYAARNDCPSYYKLEVYLLDANLEEIDKFVKSIYMRDKLHINGWHVMSHTFKNYGPGVRYIVFTHTGRDLNGWGGHYGSKMANAQVVVNTPIIRARPKFYMGEAYFVRPSSGTRKCIL